MLIVSSSCLAAWGRHPSPRIAISFFLLSSAANFSTMSCHTRLFHSYPLLILPVPPCTFHIISLLRMCVLLSIALPHGHNCACIYFVLPATGTHLFLFSGRSRSPTRSRSFSVFATSTGPCKSVFIPIPWVNPPCIVIIGVSSLCFLELAFLFFTYFLLLLHCTPQTSLRT